MVDEQPHCRCHRSPALVSLVQPVADARRAVAPVDCGVSDHPGDASLEDDGRLEAVVVGQLPPGYADEIERVVEGLVRGPRQPAGEVGPARLDQSVELPGVYLIEQAEVGVVRNLQPTRHRRTVLRHSWPDQIRSSLPKITSIDRRAGQEVPEPIQLRGFEPRVSELRIASCKPFAVG